MKKIYSLGLALFSAACLNAQITVSDTDDGSAIPNGSTYYRSTTAGNTDEIHFEFKNTSSAAKNYHVKRYDLLVNKLSSTDLAEPYYCTGLNCYPSTTTITPNPIALGAGNTEALKIYLSEASVAGKSTIKYEIYDANNPTDATAFTIVYNNPLSVKSIDHVVAVSDVYPNPVSSKGFINLNSEATLDGQMTVVNSIGSVVYSKNIEIAQGKNTISLETENLASGVYFVTLQARNQHIVKKFFIN